MLYFFTTTFIIQPFYYTAVFSTYNITPLMSRKGNPYDNALAENFFSILKTECIYRMKLETYDEAGQINNEGEIVLKIKKADIRDLNIVLANDKHISQQELINSINLNRVYIAEENDIFCGWLRYNLFWDNTPFMNMLYLLENYRGRGYGKQLVEYWEKEMKQSGYDMVMTSTPSDEHSQHFYVKLDYKTVGGFLLENDPFEVIMMKKI